MTEYIIKRIPAAIRKPFRHYFLLLLVFGIELTSIVHTVQSWVFDVYSKNPQL